MGKLADIIHKHTQGKGGIEYIQCMNAEIEVMKTIRKMKEPFPPKNVGSFLDVHRTSTFNNAIEYVISELTKGANDGEDS